MSECWIILVMAPASPPAASPDLSAAQSQPVSSSQAHRPLRREGAIIFLSAAEQALEDAMSRSSPSPEQVLGKRTHEQDDEQGAGGDTEPEEGSSSSAQAQSLAPSLSNVTAATLRYATFKKLRAEQRDELDAFLQVSLNDVFSSIYKHWPGHSTRSSSQTVCLPPLSWEQNWCLPIDRTPLPGVWCVEGMNFNVSPQCPWY